MAGTYAIEIEAGASYNRTINWTSANLPVNLNGCTARLMVRTSYSDANTTLSLVSPSACLSISNATNGDILLSLDPAVTANLVDGVYDLEVLFGGGPVTRLLSGTLTVSPEVTRG
jgi:hypothetical protein